MTAITDWRVRLTYLIAFLLTATTWLPLLVGNRWFLLTATTCGVAAALAQTADRLIGQRVGTRWFGPLTALVAGVLLLNAFLVPGGGWPGPSSLGELGRLLGDGGRTINSTVSPVAPTPQVLAVIVTALLLLWWAGDIIVTTLRHPAGGALALLAVYCVPSTILYSGVPVQLFTLSLVGVLALLGVGNRERLSAWGRRLDTPGRGRGIGHLGRGALAAVVSLALALIVPSLLPGLRGGLMAELRGEGKQGSSSALSTDLDLRRDLIRRTDKPLVRYTTTAPEPGPLRMFTVTSLDNETWHLETPPETGQVNAATLDDGASFRSRLATMVPRQFKATTVGLRQQYLPTPGTPLTFTANRGSWLFDPVSGTVTGTATSTADLQYRLTFADVVPNAAALARVSTPAAAGEDVPAKYLSTHQNSSLLRERARIVAGTGTDYVKAQRLQAWFRSVGQFTYTTDIARSTSRAAIDSFLIQRRGYCVHFATAMALMAREVGIPARVAVGLLPGQQEGVEWVASEQDAHAWPELYFTGVGWIRFEPTPSVRTGTAPSWTVRDASSTATPRATPTTTRSATPTATQTPTATTTTTASPSPTTQQSKVTTQASSLPKVLGWLSGVVGLLALLALPRLAAVLVRRRRRRVAVDPAEAAWAELIERLADLGVRPGPHLTPRATGELVNAQLTSGAARAAMARRVEGLEASRYAPGAKPPESDPQADVEAIVTDIARHRRLPQRLCATWLPRAVFRRSQRSQ